MRFSVAAWVAASERPVTARPCRRFSEKYAPGEENSAWLWACSLGGFCPGTRTSGSFQLIDRPVSAASSVFCDTPALRASGQISRFSQALNSASYFAAAAPAGTACAEAVPDERMERAVASARPMV